MVNKSAGIVTVGDDWLFTNYGSFLQHLSLQRVVRTLGWRPYRLREASIGRVLYRYLRAECAKLRQPQPWGRMATLKQVTGEIVSRLRFWKDATRLSVRSRTWENGGLQVLIVGSDQIWYTQDKRCFLQYEGWTGGRIAYAASADWTWAAHDSTWQMLYRECAHTLDAVSVRELAGAELCRRLVPDVDVAHVADPVLLYGREGLEHTFSLRENYGDTGMFAYFVNIRRGRKRVYNAMTGLAERCGQSLEFWGIQGAERCLPEPRWVMPSPTNFLKKLVSAKYVVTNSFHGTLLAILFHKPFLSIQQRCRNGENQNTRQVELLSSLELSQQSVSYEEFVKVSMTTQLQNPIDWKRVDNLVEAYRREAHAWLKAALERVERKGTANSSCKH